MSRHIEDRLANKDDELKRSIESTDSKIPEEKGRKIVYKYFFSVFVIYFG
jgi:hypothetical protein